MAEKRSWPGAAGLLLITIVLSVFNPGLVVAFPFLGLAMVLGLRGLPAAVAAMLAVLVVVGVPGLGGIWYLERGWTVLLAGFFIVVTIRWPQSRFFPRALAAVATTTASVGVMMLVQPGSWDVANWLITERMMRGVSVVLQLFGTVNPETPFPAADLGFAFEAAALQGRLFPALLGLSSLSGLGVAWWAYVRLATGSGLGLAPLREFRFNDHLVWVLVAGLALILVGAEGGWTNAGGNAVVFMGGLYVLRGAAVLLVLNGGVTGFGVLFFAAGMLILGRVLIMGVLMGALVIGVGDTWLDLRTKAAAIVGGKS